MNNPSELITFLTIIFAGVGAVLGIFNTLHNLSQQRLRLRVIPVHMVSNVNWIQPFGIEVTNLSTFPVTIKEVGLKFKWTNPRKRRAAPLVPQVLDGGSWPRRLEPRESVTVGIDPNDLPTNISSAYARTSCDEFRYGSSPALKLLTNG